MAFLDDVTTGELVHLRSQLEGILGLRTSRPWEPEEAAEDAPGHKQRLWRHIRRRLIPLYFHRDLFDHAFLDLDVWSREWSTPPNWIQVLGRAGDAKTLAEKRLKRKGRIESRTDRLKQRAHEGGLVTIQETHHSGGETLKDDVENAVDGAAVDAIVDGRSQS